MQTRQANLIAKARGVILSLLIFLVCFVSFVSSSEGLHQTFHADAGSADHYCLIVQLQSGQIFLAGAGGTLLVGFVGWLMATRILETNFPPNRLVSLLPPGRAPPCFRAILSAQQN